MFADKTPEKIQKMFDDISSYYDKVNNLISFGMHYFIKYSVLKSLNIVSIDKILDVCCGTGDNTKIISKISSGSEVYGLDFSEKMLDLAKIKNPTKQFVRGDCTNIPFDNFVFDFVIASFGLRNIENRPRAISEIHRVLKKNGKFVHLDFEKTNLFISKLYMIFVGLVIKMLDKDRDAYKYLIESKNDYPASDALIEEFKNVGFSLVSRKYFLFGNICAIVVQKI